MQVDDVVLLFVSVLRQEGPEVRAADRQHEGVSREKLLIIIVPTCQGNISELLPHDQLFHQEEEGLVVVVPFQQKLVLCSTHCNHRVGPAQVRSFLLQGIVRKAAITKYEFEKDERFLDSALKLLLLSFSTFLKVKTYISLILLIKT